MKITDELVAVINGGLQDLIVEIDLLEALERIREGEERTEEELANVDKVAKMVGLVSDDKESELRDMLSRRLNVEIGDSEQANEQLKELSNLANHTVQMDRVINFMSQRGLSQGTITEVVNLKIELLNQILAKLGVDLSIQREITE